MLKDFKQTRQPIRLPCSSETVYVHTNGNFYRRDGSEIPTYIGADGRLKLEGDFYLGRGVYDAAVCMALAYKGTYLSFLSLINLDVMFIDGNCLNIHPSNLVWRFEPGKFLYRHDPEFTYIPGFTRYVVNRQGVLIDTETTQLVKPHFERGYAKFKLESDLGKKVSIGRHRIVALAWLTYPPEVDTLVVNHKDGIPGNDWVDNLEFITRGENNKHAGENGLLRKGRVVQVRNVKTGLVQTYSGTSSCARALGLNRATIKFRLGVKGQPVYAGGYQFKYGYDATPWRDVRSDEHLDRELNVGASIPVYSRNIFSGLVTRYDSVAQASYDSGIPVMTIHHHLKGSKTQRPIHGVEFRYTDGPWPIYDEDALTLLRNCPTGKISACYVVNVEDGQRVLCTTIHEAAKYVGRTTMAVNWGISTGKLVAGKFEITRFVLTSESLLQKCNSTKPL